MMPSQLKLQFPSRISSVITRSFPRSRIEMSLTWAAISWARTQGVQGYRSLRRLNIKITPSWSDLANKGLRRPTAGWGMARASAMCPLRMCRSSVLLASPSLGCGRRFRACLLIKLLSALSGRRRGWITLRRFTPQQLRICRIITRLASTLCQINIWPIFLSTEFIPLEEPRYSLSQLRNLDVSSLKKCLMLQSRSGFSSSQTQNQSKPQLLSQTLFWTQKINFKLFWVKINKKLWCLKISKILIGIWQKLICVKMKWNQCSRRRVAHYQSSTSRLKKKTMIPLTGSAAYLTKWWKDPGMESVQIDE